MKIAFLEVLPGDAEAFSVLQDKHSVKFFTKLLTEDEIVAECKGCDVISPHTWSAITARVIDGIPTLKLVATRTAGTDHIDCAFAAQKGIAVKNVPAYGPEAVAEHAFALLLAAARRVPQADRRVRSGDMTRAGLEGIGFSGKTAGVLGTGKIGLCFAKISRGFGMRVLAHDIILNEKAAQEIGFEYVPLEKLFAESDFLSVHVPLLKETFHLINEENVVSLKKGCVLVNTSRGPVISIEALVKGLEQGRLAAVGLDVFEGEASFSKDNPLLKFENVVLTPHIAFYTEEAMQSVRQKTIENILEFEKTQH